nr:hypothetical protein [Pandoravirus aubagnensis]
MDDTAQVSAGLFGALDDSDCLVHILCFLPLKDYMTLALANKRIAAFLVDDAVLRVIWGTRLGVAGRFDPQFGPHQCEVDRNDPCVPFTIPRAWRRAAEISAICANAAHLVLALYKRNVSCEYWDKEIADGSVPSIDDISVNTAVAAQQGPRQRNHAKSWHFVWKTQWSTAVEARAPGALYTLALMLVYSLRTRRLNKVVPLEQPLADIVRATLGAEFYIAVGNPRAHTAGGVPRVDITPAEMADRALLSYWPGIKTVHDALLSFSPHAMSCVGNANAAITRLLVRAADLWNSGFEYPVTSETVNTTRHNLIVYNALRTRSMDVRDTLEARDTVSVAMYDLVPRALRRDAQRLMIACSGVDNVLSGVRGDLDFSFTQKRQTTGRDLAARMAAANHQEALQLIAESVPFACALIDNRSILVSSPGHVQHCPPPRDTAPQHPSRASPAPTEGAALVTWIRLWSISMACDLAKAFANISSLCTRNIEAREYEAAAFDATVLIDMIRAWRTSDTMRLSEDAHANMIMRSACLAVLLWATAGGPSCMERLCALVDSNDDLAWLLSSAGCRDLAVWATEQTNDAIKQVGLAHSWALQVNIRPLHSACASVPSDLTTSVNKERDAQVIALLHIVVDKLSSMINALVWCLGVDDLIDRETAERVRKLVVYLTTTHDNAASIHSAAAAKTKATA